MMKYVPRILSAAWLAFGVTLIIDAVLDTAKWHSDPYYGSVGLTWNWIGLAAGVSAGIWGGLWFVVSTKRLRLLGYCVAGLFGSYALVYLIFGGEGALSYRILLPGAVLGLCCATVWRIRNELRNNL